MGGGAPVEVGDADADVGGTTGQSVRIRFPSTEVDTLTICKGLQINIKRLRHSNSPSDTMINNKIPIATNR